MEKCLNCGSHDMIHDVRAIDFTTYGGTGAPVDMEVMKHGNPRAFIFKDTRRSSVSAVVCAKCGLIYYFANDPLYRLSGNWNLESRC